MIEVTCAIIRNDEGKVLVVRRGPGMGNAGKWEFPGGKVKSGESQEDCIIREIHEELGIDIILSGVLEPVEHDYGDKFIKLYPFICDTLATRLFLTEHDDHRWLVPEELLDVNLSAADVPVARYYASRFSPVATYVDTGIRDESFAQASDEELTNALLRITTTHEINMIAEQAAVDPLLVSQLVNISLSGDKKSGFRASWPLSKVVDINAEITLPFVCRMIDSLPGISNESVQRAFMRVIMKNDMSAIPASHHGKLVDYCFVQLRSASSTIAARAYAMEILGKMCGLYPEMTEEVLATININLYEASAGIKAQAKKVFSRLMKQQKQQ